MYLFVRPSQVQICLLISEISERKNRQLGILALMKDADWIKRYAEFLVSSGNQCPKYAAICNESSSTLHRYWNPAIFPTEEYTVERLLLSLHRLAATRKNDGDVSWKEMVGLLIYVATSNVHLPAN